MIGNFVLHQPDSVDAALQVLADHKGHATVLAGGSQLVLRMKARTIQPEHLVEVKRVRGLAELTFDPNSEILTIGAAVTHRALETSSIVRQYFPLLADLERRIGNVRIRNVGTLGGNLCAAEAHSDPPALLLAYDATLRIAGRSGERRTDLANFILGDHRTSLHDGEILLAINIHKPTQNTSDAYCSFCPCERPTVSVAAVVEINGDRLEGAKVVVGCVEAKPMRLNEIEEMLRGRTRGEVLASASEIGLQASRLCAPVDDIWCSGEYKRHIVGILAAKTIHQACWGVRHG
jgi:carbon-monoxide dehydrogenase medium subunit